MNLIDSLDMNLIPLDRLFEPHPTSFSSEGMTLKPCRDYSDVIGSCNGLIALHNNALGMALWNPSTRKHQMLRLPKFWGYSESRHWDFVLDGFGYDALSDDYKFIRIYLSIYEQCFTNRLYSLKTDASIKIKGFPKCYYSNDSPASGVLVGACLHWVLSKGGSHYDDDLIVGFGLTGEKLHIVPKPYLGYNVFVTLGVLGGCISLGCIFDNDKCLEIWVMREYKVKDSWTKICSISREDQDELKFFRVHMKPLGYSELGNKILCEQDGRYLFWYDKEARKFESVQMCGSVCNKFFAQLCVRSLVQIDVVAVTGPPNKRGRTDPNPNHKKRVNTRATGH